MFEKRKERKHRNRLKVESMVNLWEIGNELDPTDVLGSYSGTPVTPDDPVPEQDADDL